MRIVTLLLTLLTLPAMADQGESYNDDFFLVIRHGRLHLVASPGVSKVHFDSIEPTWTWEGGHTHFDVEETKYGASIHASIDIAGPYWLYIELDPTADGLCFHARHSNAGEFEEISRVPRYEDFVSQGLLGLPFLLRLLSHTGHTPIDLKRTYEVYVPARAGACLLLIRQLDDDRWVVRQNADDALHSPEMRETAISVVKGMKLSLEARTRMADLMDLPEVPPVVLRWLASVGE